MKPRILFVDDEPMVLRGLERMLRLLEDGWEMTFVESGELALQALEKAPYDVVVSDMLMPVMNGASLLREVKRRHPNIARLILSGHADHDLILQCVDTAQQFLTKPCRINELTAAIRRAFEHRPEEELLRIRTLLSRAGDLPVLPGHYRELRDAMGERGTSLAKLATIVGRDVGMTARLLKTSNSAFFGARRTVRSLQEALQCLGMETVKALVLLDGFLNQIPPTLPEELDLQGLISGSYRVAARAKRIALIEAPKQADIAFTAGLLHKAGLILLASSFPQRYQEVLFAMKEPEACLESAERAVFGVNHGQVGAYLLGLWGLPEDILGAMKLHAIPSEGPPFFTFATAIHAACVIESGTLGQLSPIWRHRWDEVHMGAIQTRGSRARWAAMEEE